MATSWQGAAPLPFSGRDGRQRVARRGVADAVLVDEIDSRSGVDRRVPLDPTVQPVDRRRLDHRGVALVGQADPVATAVPEHGHGNMVRMHLLVVGDALVQGEEGVDRALDDEGRARGCRTPGWPGPRAANQASLAGSIWPVVLACGGRRRRMCGSRERRPPPPAVGCDQPTLGMPDLSRLVVRECHEMVGTMASIRQSWAAVTHWIPPPYGTTHHAHPWITRPVELDAGSRGHPVDQPGYVLGFIVGAVDLDGPRRFPNPRGSQVRTL